MRIDSLFEMVHVAEYQKSVRKCTGQEGQTSCPVFAIAFQMVFPLYHPGHETAHSFRRLILHLAGGVGVGAERETCVIVPQHTGDRLDVHAILQGQGGKGVSQIVEADVFQSSILEDFLVEFYHGIGIVHLSRGGGREHIRVFRVLLVLLDQQIHRLLGDGYPAH